MSKILTLTIALFSLLIFIGLLPVHGEDDIYDNVIRLHVIANSDSKEDQELKLKVRDEVLKVTSGFAKDAQSFDEAKLSFEKELSKIREAAGRCVIENGYSYPIVAQLTRERYPRKNYDTFCFPSGEYMSLQIKIGEAEGQNWWCVVFPPMCMSAASIYQSLSAEDALIQIGFSSEQYKIITESENATYRVRFKILEAIESALA